VSIARNYAYNVALQITNILIPFITTPYVTRVLDPTGLGISAFTLSVVQYFILLASLGTALYGSRAIAYVRTNPEDLRKTFWEIFYVKLFAGTASSLLYVGFVLSAVRQYRNVYLIQYLNLLGSILDISYLFQGIEEFKKIAMRSIGVRVVSTVAIFLFVKRESDFVVYVLISALGNLLGQLVMWMFLPKGCRRVQKANWRSILSHIPGSLKLFIPMVAIQIYVVLDKTMVGILSSKSEVAYYDMAQKIVKMALSLVTAIGPVMLSRVSSLAAKGDKDSIDRYISDVFDFVTYASIFMIVVLFTTMRYFVPVFFGEKFYGVKDLILVISPILLFISWSNLFGVQIMIPFKMEKQFTLSVVTGAVVNFLLNLLLIPRYAALGASVATVVAEFCVTAVQMVSVRNRIPLKSMFRVVPKHALAGTTVLVFGYVLSELIRFGNIVMVIFNFAVVASVYVLMECFLKSKINSFIFSKLMSVLKRL